jgi:hypothetical protein
VRIYEGTPRQNYEEVFRSVGAVLDQRGVREILFTELEDGLMFQALVLSQTATGGWSDSQQLVKETFIFLDDDVSRFMDEGVRRRGGSGPSPGVNGYYERALRVLGRYVDQQKPRDVFFLEQDGAFVMRLLMATHAGAKHVLAEFTRDEIETLVQQGPAYRGRDARAASRDQRR